MDDTTADYSKSESNCKIRQWIESAEQGDPCAQFELGLCYATGNELKQDKKKAVKWYRKAVEHGCVSAKEALEELGEIE